MEVNFKNPSRTHPHLCPPVQVYHVWTSPQMMEDSSAPLPTCAGVPCLDEPPDDGIALVTGLFDALALLLVEAMFQENPDVGFLLIGVLSGKSDGKVTGELSSSSFPSLRILSTHVWDLLVTETLRFSPMHFPCSC